MPKWRNFAKSGHTVEHHVKIALINFGPVVVHFTKSSIVVYLRLLVVCIPTGIRIRDLDQEYIDRACPIFLFSFSCFIQQLLMTLINLSGKLKFKAMIWSHWQPPYRRCCLASVFKGVLSLLIRCLWLGMGPLSSGFNMLPSWLWRLSYFSFEWLVVLMLLCSS